LSPASSFGFAAAFWAVLLAVFFFALIWFVRLERRRSRSSDRGEAATPSECPFTGYRHSRPQAAGAIVQSRTVAERRRADHRRARLQTGRSSRRNPFIGNSTQKRRGRVPKELRRHPCLSPSARQTAGPMATKKSNRGGRAGRKPDANSKSGQIRALLGSGMSTADIAKKVGCTTALVYNVKSAAGGSGKRSPGKRSPGKRGPGRPRRAAAAGFDGLNDILAAVQQGEKQRTQMRAALERIQALVSDALG
jgi:transposase